MKNMFTIFVEYNGGTFCSQFEAETVKEAVRIYNITKPFDAGATPIGSDPVRLQGMKNVWCTSSSSNLDERLIIANIVKTRKT